MVAFFLPLQAEEANELYGNGYKSYECRATSKCSKVRKEEEKTDSAREGVSVL